MADSDMEETVVRGRETRFIEMYTNYCKELGQYFTATRPMFLYEMKDTAIEYLNDPFSEIVYAEDRAGFMIISKPGGDCHPMADYTVSQLYVRPAFRRRGIASKLVSDFVAAHPGTYALDVLDKNSAAKSFWAKTILDNGWERVVLSETRTEKTVPECTLYGFRTL